MRFFRKLARKTPEVDLPEDYGCDFFTIMLLSISIENFRSFRERQTFSMVASTRQTGHTDHLIPIPEDENQLLPVAAIYGSNGAGKSNLIKALQYAERLVCFGTDPGKSIPRAPFRLDKASSERPTSIELQFAEGGSVFAFGFAVSKVVEREWLSLLRGGKEHQIFERATDSTGEVKVELGKIVRDRNWGDHAKIQALAEVGVLPNQLFLHAVRKAVREQDQGPLIAPVLRWFVDRLTIIEPDAPFSELAQLLADDEAFTTFVGQFLKKVATGVDGLTVNTSELGEKMLATMDKELKEFLENAPTGETTAVAAVDGTQLIVEKGEGTKIKLQRLLAQHQTEDGAKVALPFSEESDGTQRLTHLLPAIHAMRSGPRVFVIDEIDRSLHPLLAKGFVRTFLESCSNKGSQLIFTTHDTAFLDLELLRRDEIWFVDKDLPRGASEMYSLSAYGVRNDLKVDKAYLEGRFRAVPPLENELPTWVKTIIEDVAPRGEAAP